MLYWLKVLFWPIKTFKESKAANKKLLNILFVFVLMGILQYLSISKLLSLESANELAELMEIVPASLIMLVSTTIQMFGIFIDVIIVSIIFRVLSKYFFKGLTFKTIVFIVILSQIPISLSAYINTLFISDLNPGILLSVFSLGYTLSAFIDNNILLHIFNTIELFQIWSAFIISCGFYVYAKKQSLSRMFLITFTTYLLIKVLISLIFIGN